MKKIIACSFIALALVAFAATELTLTVTLTPLQQRALAQATAAENQIRTNQVPPLAELSESEFAAAKLTDVINFFAAKTRAEDREALIKKYESLDEEKKAEIDTALEVKK